LQNISWTDPCYEQKLTADSAHLLKLLVNQLARWPLEKQPIIVIEIKINFFEGNDGSANPAIQRIPLPNGPAEMLEEEPLYVNAKQYQRILKRRQVILT
jgi:hypothetical protein